MNTFNKSKINVINKMNEERAEKERAEEKAKRAIWFERENEKRAQMLRNGLEYRG